MTSDDTNAPAAPELPPSTAPENIGVTLRGFADSAAAERFANVIATAVRMIGCCINLERLDGITVAFDYAEALAQLDRGYAPSQPLTATGTEQLVGVAMTPAVLRGATVKSHMVFDAPLVLGLGEEQTDRFQLALYIVAHECGHVEDLKQRDEAFPGTILRRPITDAEDVILERFSAALWEEYAACRVSATFGEGHTSVYEESFTSVLAVAWDQGNAAIGSYRLHGDIGRLLEETTRPIYAPLKVGAYLVGHLHGLGIGFDGVPQARDQLAASRYAPFMRRMEDALQELWSRRGHWASLAEFGVLKDIGRDLLAEGGIILRRLPNGGMQVDVPFTPETMPR